LGPQPLQYAGLGLQFALTFLAMGGVGWWLDRKLGTEPWLMVLGIFVGAAGAFISLIHRVPAAGKQSGGKSSTPPHGS
jgi:F0F1-type ATP synthase assembly protein I